MMRVFIADPRDTIRMALTLLLEQEPGFQIVGAVSMGAELMSSLAAARPDVVLLEWTLITAPLAEVLADIQAQASPPAVIVLSTRPEVRLVACAAGAAAFVSKGDPPSQLISYLRDLALEQDQTGA
jgi:DNA-binding NarL/FixJ family response regulator